ncbi:MAG: Obg family GTPase CgtA, partial [Acidaminococcaceae bacterium]
KQIIQTEKELELMEAYIKDLRKNLADRGKCFDNEEALHRFQLIWRKLGIDEALKAQGIEEGQSVRIRDMVFEFKDQK